MFVSFVILSFKPITMSNKFYPLSVQEIKKTTDDCAVISFDVKDELKNDFAYTQGQYLTLKTEIEGKEVRRSYSLCSSPLDNEWKVAVKHIEGGQFSTFANQQLKEGDVLEVMPPNGRFFVEVDPKQAKHYVAFAAGSGITPILSIIKTHLLAEPEARFQLFYTNQAVSTIILREEIEALKNIFLDRFEVFYFLTQEVRSSPLFNGRIDKEKLDVIFNSFIDKASVNDYFICGPNEMIFLIRDYLQGLEVDNKSIHLELFNTDIKGAKKKKVRKVDPKLMADISILEGGKNFSFQIPQGSDNILDAAIKRNADLPFACKGGMCCTCRAKLVEGKVDMEVNYALEPEEVEAGYILTCQSIPLSEKIVVDFDV